MFGARMRSGRWGLGDLLPQQAGRCGRFDRNARIYPCLRDAINRNIPIYRVIGTFIYGTDGVCACKQGQSKRELMLFTLALCLPKNSQTVVGKIFCTLDKSMKCAIILQTCRCLKVHCLLVAVTTRTFCQANGCFGSEVSALILMPIDYVCAKLLGKKGRMIADGSCCCV